MSAGRELAQRIVDQLTDYERQMLKWSNASFVEGFIIGRHSEQHSRVALRNAADHIQELLP